MRKYIRRDLSKYVDCEIVKELEKAKYSQKADRTMQAIFSELIQRLEALESESGEKEDRIKTLSESLARQQSVIMRRNQEEDQDGRLQEFEEAKERLLGKHPVRPRNEKILEMYAIGVSQRKIAEKLGVSKTRVNQVLKKGVQSCMELDTELNSESKNSKKGDPVVRQFRNQKICEWWALGFTQKEIARGVGVSRSRVAEIVSKKCTQAHQTDTIEKKAEKNGVHRNTQAKIEKIRKIAPWLAEECESGKTSVNAAVRFIESKLGKVITKSKSTKQNKQERKESV